MIYIKKVTTNTTNMKMANFVMMVAPWQERMLQQASFGPSRAGLGGQKAIKRLRNSRKNEIFDEIAGH